MPVQRGHRDRGTPPPPPVARYIAEGIDWTWQMPFWLNVPIGLAATPLVLRKIEESYGGARPRIPGLALSDEIRRAAAGRRTAPAA